MAEQLVINWHIHQYGPWSPVKLVPGNYDRPVALQDRACIICNKVKRNYLGIDGD